MNAAVEIQSLDFRGSIEVTVKGLKSKAQLPSLETHLCFCGQAL